MMCHQHIQNCKWDNKCWNPSIYNTKDNTKRHMTVLSYTDWRRFELICYQQMIPTVTHLIPHGSEEKQRQEHSGRLCARLAPELWNRWHWFVLRTLGQHTETLVCWFSESYVCKCVKNDCTFPSIGVFLNMYNSLLSGRHVCVCHGECTCTWSLIKSDFENRKVRPFVPYVTSEHGLDYSII